MNEDKYDVEAVEAKMEKEFGAETIAESKEYLSKRFNKSADSLREYFNLLDAVIAEMYNTGEDQERLTEYTR